MGSKEVGDELRIKKSVSKLLHKIDRTDNIRVLVKDASEQTVVDYRSTYGDTDKRAIGRGLKTGRVHRDHTILYLSRC